MSQDVTEVLSEADASGGEPRATLATSEADVAAGASPEPRKSAAPRRAEAPDEADAGAGDVKRPLKRARLGFIVTWHELGYVMLIYFDICWLFFLYFIFLWSFGGFLCVSVFLSLMFSLEITWLNLLLRTTHHWSFPKHPNLCDQSFWVLSYS